MPIFKMFKHLRYIILGSASKINACKRYLGNKSEINHEHVSKLKNSEVKRPVFVAAHVGSGFCRAAVVCSKGSVLHFAHLPSKIYQTGIFSEMSSENVWNTLVKCIRKVTESINKGDILGIGFTATPALVCLDENGHPVTASASRDPNINIILHYDNRSTLEGKKINKTRHSILQYLGERVFCDLQDSKLMWLKNNLKEDCWLKVGHFFELSDFLTWKATGSLIRSCSCLATQWSYEISVSGKEGWNPQFFYEIDIPEVIDDNFKKIGTEIQRPGFPLPNGLLKEVAKEMGLQPNLPVATSMPDGPTGCLGLLGCQAADVKCNITNRLCIMISRKSASHLILSRDPHFMKAVKGPFRHSVLPDMWLNQAGQTTAESILEHIIEMHPATSEITKHLGHMHIHKYLNKILKLKAHKNKMKARSFLTQNIHVLPDFEGNKSPFGDPLIRGALSGLSFDAGQESLAFLYLAAMQSLAYSTKHIINTLSQNGHDIKCILIGGYLGKNSLFPQLHQEVCQVPIITPQEPNSDLIGAAILAGIASNHFRNFNHAIQEMGGFGQATRLDDSSEVIGFHEKKFQVFLKMYDHQMEYRRIMSGENEANKIPVKK